MNFLRNFELDKTSFWIGFLAGALTLWFIGRLRILLPRLRKSISERIRKARQELLTSAEARLRNDTLRLSQRMHLAAPLFSLDELIVTPRLITPMMSYSQVNEDLDRETSSFNLPYIPDWPELAETFHAPTLSFAQALERGANLVLMGKPGSGKSVALAYLAATLARRGEAAGKLKDFLPVLVQSCDLPLGDNQAGDPLAPLLSAISEYAAPLTLPRLPNALRLAFESGQVMLLVDGLDELPAEQIDRVSRYLIALWKQYPQLRCVVAAAPEYSDGLVTAGFAPIFLANWEKRQKEQFIQHWSDLWSRFVARSLPEKETQVDPLLLNGWLTHSENSSTPLELTLRVWAAYAGDALGPSLADSVRAYLGRISAGMLYARQALQQIARQIVTHPEEPVSIKQAETWLTNLLLPKPDEAVMAASPLRVEPQEVVGELKTASDENQDPVEAADQTLSSEQADTPAIANSKATESKESHRNEQSAIARLLSDLVSIGLLNVHKNGRLSFCHPMVAGYLAAEALGDSGQSDCLSKVPEGTYTSLTRRFLMAWDDQSSEILPALENQDDPTFRFLLEVGSWLSDAPKTTRWRTPMLKKLASLVQDDIFSLGLRARALCALAGTRDPGAAALFRQLLTSHPDQVRLLAVLGSGLVRDTKAVNNLIQLLDDPCLPVSQAAVMALAAIHTQPALEALGGLLLDGREELRRCVSEALAYDPEEGYTTLVEGSQVEDLLVRRAVVYGLARVGQPWATQILEEMEIKDEQWVVRSAATQALEEMRRPNLHTPTPLPPITETPWLIEFAGQIGAGVSPGQPVTELLVQALKSGGAQYKQAALDYLAHRPDPETILPIYDILYGQPGELREAAFNTLWHMDSYGVKLPSPYKHGYY